MLVLAQEGNEGDEHTYGDHQLSPHLQKAAVTKAKGCLDLARTTKCTMQLWATHGITIMQAMPYMMQLLADLIYHAVCDSLYIGCATAIVQQPATG